MHTILHSARIIQVLYFLVLHGLAMREYYCRSINWTIHTDVCIDVTVEILGISHAIDFNF